ncbi:MAG: replication protein P [Cellvibrionaceae bacterium]|nr:replication protein P [Cellvibrionaceae bacterium]MCV6627290.1 replication protein P [Cellvibrionaceae bacterium]
MSKTSLTHPGKAEADELLARKETINQVFSLFRVNYHNQYHSAFGDETLLSQAKRLWLEGLERFDNDTILRGAKRVLETSDYLPTLNKMIRCCEGEPAQHGLPAAYSAYQEACSAPSPKAEANWSHPAVYLAGKQAGWFMLASNAEKTAFPIFKQCYEKYCEQVLAGNKLSMPELKALPEEVGEPLSKSENQKRMAALRKQLDL